MPETSSVYERAFLPVPRPSLLWQRIGGLTVLERHLFTAARAGVRSLRIGLPHPPRGLLAGRRVPAELEIRWIGEHAAAEAATCLIFSADHLLRVETLARIVRQNPGESLVFEDDAGLPVVQVLASDAKNPASRRQTLPSGSYRRIETGPASAQTIDWLMATGPKSQDGFMARHFDRHISLAVSRLLLDTPITPNLMTVLSTAIGLVGASFFLGSARIAYIPGALLVWLHSTLDGCDGELARVRFQETPFGSDLDFWGDNLVHLALFSSLGIGLWLGGNGHHVLALAAVADAGVAASAWTAWRHRLKHRAAGDAAPESGVTDEAQGGGLETRLSKLENMLAQRDFIYLLVFLALADCVYEFLWAAAIGGLLYFGIMLYLRRINEYEESRQPHPVG